ncbi:hypothetical protein QR680_000507 [Steinernema hermaphroditum]|uniref:Uncharacterized protein n=1 Tax=Steinernema hermaphroditum TaxID=289476 RepID=A0AA39GUV3_9BILA|nr:hypothetical protein QR680_000507 [Steinernema hermaphroditum]
MVIFKECLKYHTKLYCERREHLIVFGSLFLLLAIFATIVVLNIVITELKNIRRRYSARARIYPEFHGRRVQHV